MATEDTTENTAPAEAAAKTSSGLLKAVGTTVGLFVMMLIAQLIGPVIGCKVLPDLTPACQAPVVAEEKGKPGAKKKEVKPKAPPVYLAMDPPMVVSFQDQGSIRFLQVAVEVMTRDEKVLEQVKTHMPVIRNNLLMLMGGQNLTTLTNRDDKEKLRQQALVEVQRILKENAVPGKDGKSASGNVEDLYFTSFVVQ